MELRIRHITRFSYYAPVSESAMEMRLHPRTDTQQRCLAFNLIVTPSTSGDMYSDYLDNIIHTFDIPGRHTELTLTSSASVETSQPPPLPDALPPDVWQALDDEIAEGDFWEALAPSTFARSTRLLQALADEWDIRRRDDPLQMMREINDRIYTTFAYVPESTSVDSSIDLALETRQGVCQDFTHVMIALVRKLGIPCRYVSGYLYHRGDDHDRAGGRRDARLVRSVSARPGLGGLRPDQ